MPIAYFIHPGAPCKSSCVVIAIRTVADDFAPNVSAYSLPAHAHDFRNKLLHIT